MDFLKTDYLQGIFNNANKCLENEFTFSKSDFTSFQIINALLVERIFNIEEASLLISLPTKEQQESVLPITVLLPVLKCFLHNINIEKSISVGDIVIKADCGTISSVKAIGDNKIFVLPVLKSKRIELQTDSSILILNQKNKERIIEIQTKDTILKRQKGIDNLKSELLNEIQNQNQIFSYLSCISQKLPAYHKTKVIVIASKKETLQSILPCIPFQYINKNGKVEDKTSFDPILYVVNDFGTAKEFIIEKGIEVDTIIFIGDNKYKTITSTSRLYRQGKFKRCIFIGTGDIESADKFKVIKWNWTLPETKYYSNATNFQINTVRLLHLALSSSILDYIKIVDIAEQQSENLINLKKSLHYIRKIYPITALNNERIKSRANSIFKDFEREIEELFQDEYQSIDKDYKPEFENLKKQFKKVIDIIKNDNVKAQWFKELVKDIDFIVVPKVIRPYWAKEIERCLQSQQTVSRIRSFADLSNLNQSQEQPLQSYKGLKSAQAITLKEFEQKEADNKKYLFLSFYGYGVYPETLLEKIYAKNVVSDILLYDEEYKAFQYHLHKFNERAMQEFRSVDREELIGIKYPETQPNIAEDIDQWIKYLIEVDNFKFSKAEEVRYEIAFEEITRKIKERESRNVYVEGYDEHHKEIHELKKGDKVRIYQNPDIETLHDIIKMTDEKELFLRVDKFSTLWKSSLKNYLSSKGATYSIKILFEELVANGLSVSINQLENWMHPDNKTKFPKRKIDFSAIIKTVNNQELTSNWKFIMETVTEYLGTLNYKGRIFSDEIDNYILTEEKGNMLSWLSDSHIEKIITDGAPLRTIKEIKKLDYEITD